MNFVGYLSGHCWTYKHACTRRAEMPLASARRANGCVAIRGGNAGCAQPVQGTEGRKSQGDKPDAPEGAPPRVCLCVLCPLVARFAVWGCQGVRNYQCGFYQPLAHVRRRRTARRLLTLFIIVTITPIYV